MCGSYSEDKTESAVERLVAESQAQHGGAPFTSEAEANEALAVIEGTLREAYEEIAGPVPASVAEVFEGVDGRQTLAATVAWISFFEAGAQDPAWAERELVGLGDNELRWLVTGAITDKVIETARDLEVSAG